MAKIKEGTTKLAKVRNIALLVFVFVKLGFFRLFKENSITKNNAGIIRNLSCSAGSGKKKATASAK